MRSADGAIGRVDKDHVRKAPSRSIIFENTHVTGYTDNPGMVVILDGDGLPDAMLQLDRSFREHLRENVDRETAERMTKQPDDSHVYRGRFHGNGAGPAHRSRSGQGGRHFLCHSNIHYPFF